MKVHDNRERQAESLAVGLGWFSVALGLAELAALIRTTHAGGTVPSRVDVMLSGKTLPLPPTWIFWTDDGVAATAAETSMSSDAARVDLRGFMERAPAK